MRTAPRRAGFTLVELLVVMGIIAILAGILLPAVMAARRKAQESSTTSLIHQCEMAAQSFFNDYGDYPPTTWSGVDRLFETDPWNLFVGFAEDDDGSGDYRWDRDAEWDDPYYNSPVEDHPGYVPYDGVVGEHDPADIRGPSRTNEGIEAFAHCLLTRNGGPYLELESSQLANTDGDYDRDIDSTILPPARQDGVPDVFETTNWIYGSSAEPRPLYEIVDYWGEPLAYFHNRDYMNYDPNPAFAAPGSAEQYAGPGYVLWEDADDDDWPDSGEVTLDANQLYNVGSRGTSELDVPPNLDSFQMYSWGVDGEPGAYYPAAPREERQYWRDNLRNWEE